MRNDEYKSFDVIINSLALGGAEKILETLSFNLQINNLFLIENKVYFNVNAANIYYLNSKLNYFSKIISIFVDPLKIFFKRGRNGTIMSFLKRSNYLNIILKLYSGHNAILCEHSIPFYGNKSFESYVYRILYNKANLIIVPSTGLKNYLIKTLKITAPIEVIGNPFDFNLICEMAKKKPENHLKDINKYILNVGRSVKLKNQIGLLKSFKRLSLLKSDIELVFIGNGPETKNLIEFTTNNNLKNKVHFIDFESNIYYYIKNSAVVVSNSDWESFGNVIVESIILKKTIISTNCDFGPAEIMYPQLDLDNLQHFKIVDNGIIIPTRNDEILFSALSYYFDDLEKNSSFFEMSDIQLIDKYSLDHVIERYNYFLNLYER